MPNLDAGHYFLTVLAPIRTDTVLDPITGRSRSHRHQLAQKLALLPTGRQTSASPHDAEPSPFAKNLRNHFARFVIINQPAYNGRLSGNTLVAIATSVNPLKAQPVDRLNSAFLLFTADIDARDPLNAEADLRAYADTLWATISDDLHAIFAHCVGFESGAAAITSDGFFAYLKSCQIETTMPFNDYWPDKLQAPPAGPLLMYSLGVVLIAVALMVGAHYAGWRWWSLLIPLGGIYALYRLILSRALLPFPTAPGSDLPSILKSLFVQQHFTHLAIEAQGLDDQALHARFGAFLAEVQPRDLASPTQNPGQVGMVA